MRPERHIRPINYNDQHTNAELITMINAGQLAQISGWGMTETNEEYDRSVAAGILKIGNIRFIAQSHFNDPKGKPVRINQRYLVSDAALRSWPCKGDSGGNL